mmetsp:Transcript_42604/g.103050  ORF Transcript_42604/g.103050 Transcript_42604/m.103050 type:complete len:201 (-) Transcript_42604:502-1104(-)
MIFFRHQRNFWKVIRSGILFADSVHVAKGFLIAVGHSIDATSWLDNMQMEWIVMKDELRLAMLLESVRNGNDEREECSDSKQGKDRCPVRGMASSLCRSLLPWLVDNIDSLVERVCRIHGTKKPDQIVKVIDVCIGIFLHRQGFLCLLHHEFVRWDLSRNLKVRCGVHVDNKWVGSFIHINFGEEKFSWGVDEDFIHSIL